MSQVPTWHGVVDDKGVLALDETLKFKAHIRTLAGNQVTVVIRRRQSQRSLDQNAYWWGVAYPIMADALGYDSHEIDDLHYALVAKCFGEHFDKRLGAMVPNKRSSQLTTTEGSHYTEWLVRFAATDCGGVVVPLPGESEAA